ncbi:GerMN domain-containing protein [Clostridium isatidis]|uniref:GerMN domain-containing protein n=1 Tax=Clostridium isatidis TaxID=182773 RepID=UPI003AADCE2A
MKKKLLILILSLAALLFVSCANSIEKIEPAGKNPNTDVVENNSEEENKGENATENRVEDNIIIDFYVLNENADGFNTVQKEYEEIDLVKIVQDSIIESNSTYKETKVLGIEVKDGVAYVDLTSEFFDDNNSNSSTGARAKIYSIVNTLCYNEVLDIQEVTFLKEGVAPETIGPLSNGIFQPKEEI